VIFYIQKQDLIYMSVDDCISHTGTDYMFWPRICKPSTSQSFMHKTLCIRKFCSSSIQIFCMNDCPVDGLIVSTKQLKFCIKNKQPIIQILCTPTLLMFKLQNFVFSEIWDRQTQKANTTNKTQSHLKGIQTTYVHASVTKQTCRWPLITVHSCITDKWGWQAVWLLHSSNFSFCSVLPTCVNTFKCN
jgi:hypothetical protein